MVYNKRSMMGLLVGILLLSAALVWHDLGTHEVLGRDENATITKIDQPDLASVLQATTMKVTGQPGNMQPLYFFLQHLLWPVIERSTFAFRFLSSAFGILVVALTFKLGKVLWDSETGLVGALLTALLPFHVRYAQIARPYTLLALFSLASACFLVRALQTNRLRHWLGFVLTAALNFYTHFNALFVLAVQGVYTAIVWLVTAWGVFGKRQSIARLTGPLLGFLGVAVVCTPGLIRFVGLPWVAPPGGDGAGAAVTIELTVPFLRHFLYTIGLPTIWLQNLILVSAGWGVAVTLYRRNWQAALLSVLWLLLPFLILTFLRSPRPFEERYVIFVTPVALLVIGQGVVGLGLVLGAAGRRLGLPEGRWLSTAVLSAVLAVLFAVSLRAYYDANRAVDRLDETLAVVESRARSGDIIVISPRFLVRPLDADGADVTYLAPSQHPTSEQMDDWTRSYDRVWILYTSYLPPIELQEPLDRWVQAQGDAFVRVPIKSINALAYQNLVFLDTEPRLEDRISLLEEMAENSSGKHEAWQRYGLVADDYEALAVLHANRGEHGLADQYQKKAEETRSLAPPP
ncbi:glycosyltransferase family 39 protein [Chloroflexota bacterium]